MKISLWSAAAVAVAMMVAGTASDEESKTAASSSANTPPEGFTALFNGKDLTNWQGLVKNIKVRKTMTAEEIAKLQPAADQKAKDHWTVKDGVLEYDGMGDSLCTLKDYGNFEFY